jgi:hypothetical protein
MRIRDIIGDIIAVIALFGIGYGARDWVWRAADRPRAWPAIKRSAKINTLE